jgi:spore germination cell wall hydrolase CwlJ-like protein
MNTLMIVALTILGEARGEGSGGMYRVACVIQQRETNRGLSAKKVCLQRRQFSCWNKAAPSRALLNTDQGKYALKLAALIVAGKDLNRGIISNADHYCTLRTRPKWAKGQKAVAVYGNHKFYKLKK